MEPGSEDRREYTRVSKQNRREFARVLIRLETKLLSGSEFQVSGWTKDISVKGVFVLCAEKLPVGARCRCRLALGDNQEESPVIEVSGWVVRCENSGIAIQFSDYSVDCFNKLRQYFW